MDKPKPQSDRLLEAGTYVAHETFWVERLLGEGAFAEVYLVRHRYGGEWQAMKVFREIDAGAEERSQRLSEVSLLASLNNPNIVVLREVNVVETAVGMRPFFTMPYARGGTLLGLWSESGPGLMAVELAVDLMCQICKGVAAAHGQNPPIVHRDLKPQNILVHADGPSLQAIVSDFGLAKHANELTLKVSARGTLRFKAPEVYLDSSQDSCEGDVWALGSILYLLLTDLLPYEDVPETELTPNRLRTVPLILPSQIRSDSGSMLDAIVAKALRIEPQDRYRNAGEMLAELMRWEPSNLADEGEEIKRAFALAQTSGGLLEAADRLEQLIAAKPTLESEYRYFIDAWRSGRIG